MKCGNDSKKYQNHAKFFSSTLMLSPENVSPNLTAVCYESCESGYFTFDCVCGYHLTLPEIGTLEIGSRELYGCTRLPQ